jgi:hypothetical protein
VAAPPVEIVTRIANASALGRDQTLSFDEVLDMSSDQFQRMRYIHQYGREDFHWIGGDIHTAVRRVIFDMYPTEYADVRLPLPEGALPLHMQNEVVEIEMTLRNKLQK